jgi:hypothetical protein
MFCITIGSDHPAIHPGQSPEVHSIYTVSEIGLHTLCIRIAQYVVLILLGSKK